MKTVLKIEGMNCDHCRQSITKALSFVAGVASAEVSLQTNKAVITSAENVDPKVLVKAVVSLGYKASLL